MLDWTLVLAGAFGAGLIDAMVGGGGLIQLPTLLATQPGTAPAYLLGTSKFAGVFGTFSSLWRYARTVQVPWAVVIPGCVLAALTSLAGAITVSHVPQAVFRPLVPVLLSAVLAYTLVRRDFGHAHRPQALTGARRATLFACVAAIGFYDGFFGPGTGSFLMLLYVRVLGYDFLHAAASARAVNVATNLAALAWFLPRGEWLPGIALGMAVLNVTGAQVGTRLALRHGAGFVRWVFIAVVSALIAKTGWDALLLLGLR
jgi:uncharacterized membrane protein YfcA